jgi:integrase
MKITNAIVWDHRGRVKHGGKGQLEVRITFERKNYYFGTGIKIHKSEFVAGRIVNCAGADELNKRLEIIYKKVLACVNACVDNNMAVNTETIRKQVWQVIESQSDEPTLIQWIEEQIPHLPIGIGTRKHYQTLVSRLTEYDHLKKWQDVTVENISKWNNWLHTLTKPISDAKTKAGAKPELICDGAIYNYHKMLRALLVRAVKFEKLDRNPYDLLKFKKGDKESVEYLTDVEMKRFEAIILQKGSTLDVVHDLFIFQMYTGLPFSDMQAFDASDYKWDGKAWRHVGERIKTGIPYVSQLLPPAVKVLEKYGWEIPNINNADYNRHLKSLGQMAGIKTRLHSHLARHTFATWMLRNGASIENVSKMLGHTNITQTQRYAKVQAQAVYDDFERVAAQMAPEPNPKRKKKQP